MQNGEKPSALPADTFRFHHLGVAVADLEQAIPVYLELFGYEVFAGPFDDSVQEARVVFVGAKGAFPGGSARDFVMELVAPLGEDSRVGRLVARGGGAYHVCYEVDDIEDAVAELHRRNCLVVSRPTPAVAFDGRRIAWLYTPTRQLVELVEA